MRPQATRLSTAGPHRPARYSGAAALWPGLALTGAIAALALGLDALAGINALSPLLLAILGGILVQNTFGAPASAAPGTGFALRRVLRLGIILLGLQLTFDDLRALGPAALLVVAATLAASYLAIMALGRLFGVARPLVQLIAAGTAVCGASAILAANTVARAREEDVTYAVACVTVLGSLAMVLYPLLATPLALDAMAYGLWTGATVHEVAQVAAAGFQRGDEAGQYAMVAKLSRVILLVPLLLAMAAVELGSAARRMGTSPGAVPMPWFVLGFAAMVTLGSLVPLPEAVLAPAALLTSFLLAMGLAAMGLQTDMFRLRARGMRPLALGAAGWLFIAVFGYGALRLAGF